MRYVLFVVLIMIIFSCSNYNFEVKDGKIPDDFSVTEFKKIDHDKYIWPPKQ